jgi:hypothetical protein
MAELNYQADVNDTKENQFDPVPAAIYTVVVEDSDYADNKNQTGRILKITYQIIDGPMKGKKIFENLNLENESAQAEQISRRALNALCVACDVTNLKDSAMLHNIPLKIDVGIKPPVMAKDAAGNEYEQYPMGNKIKKHLPLDDKKSVAANTTEEKSAPATQSKGKAASAKKHPWEK